MTRGLWASPDEEDDEEPWFALLLLLYPDPPEPLPPRPVAVKTGELVAGEAVACRVGEIGCGVTIGPFAVAAVEEEEGTLPEVPEGLLAPKVVLLIGSAGFAALGVPWEVIGSLGPEDAIDLTPPFCRLCCLDADCRRRMEDALEGPFSRLDRRRLALLVEALPPRMRDCDLREAEKAIRATIAGWRACCVRVCVTADRWMDDDSSECGGGLAGQQ